MKPRQSCVWSGSHYRRPSTVDEYAVRASSWDSRPLPPVDYQSSGRGTVGVYLSSGNRSAACVGDGQRLPSGIDRSGSGRNIPEGVLDGRGERGMWMSSAGDILASLGYKSYYNGNVIDQHR